MKFHLPKLSSPNLSLPKSSKTSNELTKMFKSNGNGLNTSGILNEAKGKVPQPLKKFIPNLNGPENGNLDMSKVLDKSSLDVNTILSKNSSVSDIVNSFKTDYEVDIGGSYIPSDVQSASFNLS